MWLDANYPLEWRAWAHTAPKLSSAKEQTVYLI